METKEEFKRFLTMPPSEDDNLVTVSMTREALAELKWLTEEMTKSNGKEVLPINALRQAIATQAYIERIKKENGEFLVRRKNGELYKVTFQNVQDLAVRS